MTHTVWTHTVSYRGTPFHYVADIKLYPEARQLLSADVIKTLTLIYPVGVSLNKDSLMVTGDMASVLACVSMAMHVVSEDPRVRNHTVWQLYAMTMQMVYGRTMTGFGPVPSGFGPVPTQAVPLPKTSATS